jgi:hypothetical protein
VDLPTGEDAVTNPHSLPRPPTITFKARRPPEQLRVPG